MENMFRLPQPMIDHYAEQPPPWGFPCGGGNTLGELTFVRTYSRAQSGGGKERWVDVVRRVVEGCYTILSNHAVRNRLPYSDEEALRSAEEMFDRIWQMKFLPPGRGLWMMGTPFVHARQDSAALNNCAFVSTDDLPSAVRFAMDALMLGVGVGFDTRGAGAPMYRPGPVVKMFRVPDSREGWADSVRDLLLSYLQPNRAVVRYDYSLVRLAGSPIRGFGGVSAGPEPLAELHETLRALFDRDVEGGWNGHGSPRLSVERIVDVMNLIGRCVVAGNVRRSAEIALGPGTGEFVDLKDPMRFPERTGWSWASNNSVIGEVGSVDYDGIAHRVVRGGEPGVFYLDLARSYGRLVDQPSGVDYRAAGTNPCSEQTLESFEVCNLVETFPAKHRTLQDFIRTLKYAYLYAKAVTLLPTLWPDTNAIILRNRRIGCSVSGIAQFTARHGLTELRTWLDAGYEEIRRRDRQYAEWLCIRESIKTTSVKPSGTVSLLAGATPGVHFPVARTYIRRIQLGEGDPLAGALERAGYPVEPSLTSPRSVVAELPVRGAEGLRTEAEVSMWEKTALAVLLQRYWADNQVSCTVSFDAEREGAQLADLMRTYEGQLKSIAFLPLANGAYEQMPYEAISDEEYQRRTAGVSRVELMNSDQDAEGERYCTTDRCEV